VVSPVEMIYFYKENTLAQQEDFQGLSRATSTPSENVRATHCVSDSKNTGITFFGQVEESSEYLSSKECRRS